MELELRKNIIVEIIEYIPDVVVSRTIIKKTTGNLTAMSFDRGEELCEKTVPFNTYIQIIEGEAEITINKRNHHIKLGSGIIIPAHSLHCFKRTSNSK